MAIDITKYNVNHTGAKTQSGGLNIGLIIAEYHGSLYKLVIKPPKNETPNAANTNTNKETIFFNKGIKNNLQLLKVILINFY